MKVDPNPFESIQPGSWDVLRSVSSALCRTQRSDQSRAGGIVFGDPSALSENQKSAHTESLMCALGALAGYSCQAAARIQAVEGGLSETDTFVTKDTEDGNRYFFGESINRYLIESEYSVMACVRNLAKRHGCTTDFNVDEVFEHVVTTLNSKAFGNPRIPDIHAPHDHPADYVRNLWPSQLPVITGFVPNAEYWPLLLMVSVNSFVFMTKSVFDPCIALQLVVESAIPMSAISLSTLGRSLP